MIRIFIIFLLFPCVIFATPAAQLSALLNQFHTFHANFTQKTEDRAHRVVSSSEGRVTITRPGKFYWETLRPMHQIVTLNNNTIKIYDVDLAETTEQPMQAGPVNPAALLASSDVDLLQQFEITENTKGSSQIFTLTPKNNKDEAQFKSIQLIFVNQTLSQIIIHDTLSQTNVFSFTKK